MAYYFMVESKRGQHISLDIKKSIYYQIVTSKYKKQNAFSLEEIDSFTMMFDTEIELRNVLISEGILPIELHNKPLSIRNLLKGKYEKVRHDFLYQKDLEYIAQPKKVIEFVMNKYYQNDFLFIQKLASNFLTYHECSSTAPEVLQATSASMRDGKKHTLLESIDQNGDLLVTRLVKLIIYKHYENPNGKIDYKDEVNYKNLHSIVAFINHYYYKLEPPIEQITLKEFEFNKNKNNIEKKQQILVTPKKKTKKITPLEGQISFFD